MKKNILKFAFLLSTFILLISCSLEAEHALEQELVTTNLLSDQTAPCIDNNLETRGYCITYIFVEYVPGISREEKQLIRDPYCGNLIAVALCPINPNGELWTVRGSWQCSEEPSVLPPVDPDLRQSLASDFGQCQYPFIE